MDRGRSRDRQVHTGEQSSSQADNRANPSNRLDSRPNGPQPSAVVALIREDVTSLAEELEEIIDDDDQARDVAAHEEVDDDDIVLLDAISTSLADRRAARQPQDMAVQDVADLFIAEALLAPVPAAPAAGEDEAPSEGMGVIPVDSQGVPHFEQQRGDDADDDMIVILDDDVQMDAVEVWPPPGHQDGDPDVGPMLPDGVPPRRRSRRRAPLPPSSIRTRSARRAEAAAAAAANRSRSPQGPRRYSFRSPTPPISHHLRRHRSPPPLPLPDYDEDLLRLSHNFNERFPARPDPTEEEVNDDLFNDLDRQHQQLFAPEDEIEIVEVRMRNNARLDRRIVGYGAENVEERRNIEREKREREERIKRAVEANNNQDSLTKRYSRACGICTTPNPPVRYALYACGHMLCAACVEQVQRVSPTKVSCPFCRATTGYVRLFEVEEESVEVPAAEASEGAPPVPASPPVAVTSGSRKRFAPSSPESSHASRHRTRSGTRSIQQIRDALEQMRASRLAMRVASSSHASSQ